MFILECLSIGNLDIKNDISITKNDIAIIKREYLSVNIFLEKIYDLLKENHMAVKTLTSDVQLLAVANPDVQLIEKCLSKDILKEFTFPLSSSDEINLVNEKMKSSEEFKLQLVGIYKESAMFKN